MSEKKKSGPQNSAKNKPIYDNAFSGITGGNILKKTAANPSSADERKTVILDSELEGLDLDDKVWLFWNRNKNTIIAIVLVVFVSAAVSGLWRTYRESERNAVSDAYAAASTDKARTEFAESYSGTMAAGAALIQNADDLFNAGKYAEAAPLYKKAASNLGGTLLWGRALLGEAVSLVKSGNVEAGKAALEALAEKLSAGVYSAEAGFHVAMMDFEAGKTADAKTRFMAVSDNPQAGYWKMMADNYLARLAD